ncbi:MAG: hypothetical protein ABIT08_02270 [Bacteroidia bacterium]
MTTARNRFISFLIKECSGLNYVLLNYIYYDLAQIPSHETLEFLIDKDDYKTLLYVISSAKEIKSLKSRKEVGVQIIKIVFADHSSFVMKIKIELSRNGIILMNSREMLKHSLTNNENIKIPAPCYQFENILLSSIFNKKDVDEKFRNYFSNFNFETRSKIFAHIRPKYNFILNVLDDLYAFNDNNYSKIRNTIKSQKQNKGWRYSFHKIVFAFDYLIRFSVTRWEQLRGTESHSENQRTVSHELKNLLQRNSLIRY